MYIHYAKLWKLLIDKNMSKTALMEITGISSRVMAKLSKNETVTTDTIARICSALHCDVSDIMECADEAQISFYDAYRKFGKCTEETDVYKKITFSVGENNVTVFVSKKCAVKATHILCDTDGGVYFEQLHPIATYVVNTVRTLLVKPKRNSQEIIIVLIKGKPGLIQGLDENGFVSSRGKRKKDTDIFVMSEAAFKLFAPEL